MVRRTLGQPRGVSGAAAWDGFARLDKEAETERWHDAVRRGYVDSRHAGALGRIDEESSYDEPHEYRAGATPMGSRPEERDPVTRSRRLPAGAQHGRGAPPGHLHAHT